MGSVVDEILGDMLVLDDSKYWLAVAMVKCCLTMASVQWLATSKNLKTLSPGLILLLAQPVILVGQFCLPTIVSNGSSSS